MTDDITGTTPTTERADLLAALAGARYWLRHTARELTEEQARATPTASALSVGGLVKHVAQIEDGWARFVQGDSAAVGSADDPAGWERHALSFRLLDGETLEGALARYAEVAAATDALVATIDLDATTALPPAPWFEPGARWSARRVALHIVGETAQHAGHADILRETIDGAKSMG
jgi:hypothetical protein